MTSKFPSQRALQLPLLAILDETGGATVKQAADKLAENIGLNPEARARCTTVGGAGSINEWDRHIRFVALKARHSGLLEAPERGWWAVTPKGQDGLRMQTPGRVVTVFVTAHGTARWAYCEDAVTFLHDGEVNLILTSPPYPLSVARRKGYGGEDPRTWLDNLRRRAEGWRRVLAEDGSLLLNLGQEWIRGEPSVDPLAERLLISLIDDLGLKLCQRLYWDNPAKMPAPAEWVTVRRERLTPSVEPLYWLSPSAHPNADNRRVLRPYSESMRKRQASGGEKASAVRPSGHAVKAGAFARDNGGSIAHALLDNDLLGDLVRVANTSSNDTYLRQCKAAGLPIQPARMPAGLADALVLFLTEPGQLVYDPHAGSGTTPDAAERHGRRWVADECSLTFLAGAQFRFDGAPGFQSAIGTASAANSGNL